MAHGQDTDELLRRIAACQHGEDELDISDLRLTSLPPLPDGILELDCIDTEISEFPPLPVSLQNFYCSYMPYLTRLPQLPDGLQILDCYNSPLSQLPPLPSDLRHLCLGYTRITALPALPPKLQHLDVARTPISVLPSLPTTLMSLDIRYSYITELPLLPERMGTQLYTHHTALALPRRAGETIADLNARWEAWREERRQKAATAAIAAQIRDALADPDRFRRRVWALTQRTLRRTLHREPTQAELDAFPLDLTLLEEAAFEFHPIVGTAEPIPARIRRVQQQKRVPKEVLLQIVYDSLLNTTGCEPTSDEIAAATPAFLN